VSSLVSEFLSLRESRKDGGNRVKRSSAEVGVRSVKGERTEGPSVAGRIRQPSEKSTEGGGGGR